MARFLKLQKKHFSLLLNSDFKNWKIIRVFHKIDQVLEDNTPLETISKYTGLSTQELEDLKQTNS